MILLVLGILDMISGSVLSLSTTFDMVGNSMVFLFAVIFIIKGLWSLLASISAGFYFDLLGLTDILASILLFLANVGLVHNFFIYIGIIVVLKGIYSFVMGVIE